MDRRGATLGHTGRPLTADRWTAAIYLMVAAAALLQVAAPLSDRAYLPLLWLSGLAWIAAFGLFAVRYGRLLLTRRSAGAVGGHRSDPKGPPD